MTTKDFSANLFALFITIISIVILIISVVFALNSHVSGTELKEIQASAEKLVTANFDTATYFGIASLSPSPDYQAKDYPAGVVPCSTEIFTSYNELYDFINNTYVSNTSAILLNSETNGIKRYSEINGKLCMAVVTPKIDYSYDWSTYKLQLTNVKNDSADIIVTMNYKTSGQVSHNGTNMLKLKMVKQNGKWLLGNFVY